MIRVHQFDKAELVQILKPEDSFRELKCSAAMRNPSFKNWGCITG